MNWLEGQSKFGIEKAVSPNFLAHLLLCSVRDTSTENKESRLALSFSVVSSRSGTAREQGETRDRRGGADF